MDACVCFCVCLCLLHLSPCCSLPNLAGMCTCVPVGSGPSVWLATKRPVHSLIIHSGIMSGLRVLTTSRLLCCFDIFPNVSRLSRVSCPVLFMHGQHDEEVPISHAHGNMAAVPKALRARPWFPEFAGHNDMYLRCACNLCVCVRVCACGVCMCVCVCVRVARWLLVMASMLVATVTHALCCCPQVPHTVFSGRV
mgnify:CR=1 FL=1